MLVRPYTAGTFLGTYNALTTGLFVGCFNIEYLVFVVGLFPLRLWFVLVCTIITK